MNLFFVAILDNEVSQLYDITPLFLRESAIETFFS